MLSVCGATFAHANNVSAIKPIGWEWKDSAQNERGRPARQSHCNQERSDLSHNDWRCVRRGGHGQAEVIGKLGSPLPAKSEHQAEFAGAFAVIVVLFLGRRAVSVIVVTARVLRIVDMAQPGGIGTGRMLGVPMERPRQARREDRHHGGYEDRCLHSPSLPDHAGTSMQSRQCPRRMISWETTSNPVGAREFTPRAQPGTSKTRLHVAHSKW